MSVPVERAAGLGVELRKVGLILPHQVFAVMRSHNWEVDAWANVWGSAGEREAYWLAIGQANEDWYAQHPQRERIERQPSLACPVRVHGDDGAYKKGLEGLSAMILSMGSPVTAKHFGDTSLVRRRHSTTYT